MNFGAIVIGASGKSEVRDNIEREQISGTPRDREPGHQQDCSQSHPGGREHPRLRTGRGGRGTGRRTRVGHDERTQP